MLIQVGLRCNQFLLSLAILLLKECNKLVSLLVVVGASDSLFPHLPWEINHDHIRLVFDATIILVRRLILRARVPSTNTILSGTIDTVDVLDELGVMTGAGLRVTI